MAGAVVAAAFLVPVSAPQVADAAVLQPSGLQTGMQIDGDKTAGSPPGSFDWNDIISGVGIDGSFTFTGTGPYTTGNGYTSTGVTEASFDWDNSDASAACESTIQDATAVRGSQTPASNPWVPAPGNVNDKGNLCSLAYAVETVQPPAGQRHVILYSYFTRRVGNGAVSVYDLFEGPAAGRCDDLLLQILYPGGTATFETWQPAAGDGCADPLGPGVWVPSGRSVDFQFAMGVRTEGPVLTSQQNETFGEYAIDLTTAGLFADGTCSSFAVSTNFTRTGTSAGAQIQDFLAQAQPLTLTNCGTLTVTKDVSPAGAPADEFGFTVSGGAGPVQPGPPAVDRIVDTLVAGQTRTYTGVLASSTLHLEETSLPPPWSLQSAVCSYVSPVTGERVEQDVTDPGDPITVLPGAQTDCVLTNTAALVTVTKQTDPDGAEGQFTFDVDGREVTLGDGESRSFAFAAGTPVTIAEAQAPGWVTPPRISCTTSPPTTVDATSVTVTAVAGENVECTFTNTQLGTVVITKEAHGEDGRTFSFTSTIPGAEAFDVTVPLGDGTLVDTTFDGVAPGTYTVTEVPDADPDPMQLVDLICTVDGQDVLFPAAGRTATFTLTPGGSVRCFYTNSLPGRIFVTKLTEPFELDQQFPFTFAPAVGGVDGFVLNGNPDGQPTGSVFASPQLDAGTYTIEEAGVDGWSLTDLSCTAPDDQWDADLASGTLTVRLPENSTVACFVTNTAAPARLALTKTVTGADPGLAWRFDAALTPQGGSPAPAVLAGTGAGTATVSWTDLVPGTRYVVSEAAVTGWTMGAITCADADGPLTDLDTADLTFTFDARVGQDVACGMTNTPQTSSLTLTKLVTGVADSYAWSFQLGIDPVPAGGTSPVTVSSTGQTPDQASWSGLVPGRTYRVFEVPDAPAGWDDVPPTATCTGVTDLDPGTPGITFVAPVSSTVSCALTNVADQVVATIVKTSVGGAGAFTFTLGSPEEPDTTLLVTTDETTGTGQGSLQLVPGRHYSLAEADAVGWVERDLACEVTPLVGPPAAIPDLSDFTVAAGDAVACAATNTPAPGSVSFTKTVAGVDGEYAWAFPITLDPAPAGEPGTRTVSGSGPTSATVTWTDVEPGRHTLAEGSIDGWSPGGVRCNVPDADPEAPGVQLDVEAGAAYTCAATNTALPGSVSVRKDARGVGPLTAWSFDVTIAPVPAGQPGTQTLSGQGPGLGAGSVAWTGLVPGAAYTLTETGATGWTGTFTCGLLGDLSGVPGFQVEAEPGLDLACEAVNTATAPTGTVTKTTVGGDGAFDVVLTPLDGGAPTTTTVTTADGTGTAALAGLVPGVRYALAEQPAAGWQATAALACTVQSAGAPGPVTLDVTGFVLAPGDTVACTATNTRLGAVVITKEAHGADGRTFRFTSTIPGGESFDVDVPLGDGTLYETTFPDVPPGTYTVTELPDDDPDPMVLADLACNDVSFPPGGRTATFTVEPGQTARCFFTNTLPGRIFVIKRTVPSEYDQLFDYAFSPEVDGVGAFTLNGDSSAPPNGALWSSPSLLAGTYTVTEGGGVPGWTLTDVDCNVDEDEWDADLATGELTIDLPEGGVVTCFFTNTADTASLSVTKSVTGTAPGLAWSFPLRLTPAAAPSETQTVSSSTTSTATWTGLQPGVLYTLHEPTTAGWTPGAVTCQGLVDADPAAGFQLRATPGQAITCALANTAQPAQVQVTKTVTGLAGTTPAIPWSFPVTLSGGGGAPVTRNLTGAGASTSAPQTWTDLVPGTRYTLAEGVVPGWTQGTVQCTGLTDLEPGTPGFQLDARPGQQASCAVTNNARAARVTVTKTVQGIGPDLVWSFPVTITPVVTPQGTQVVSGTGPGSGTVSWTALLPGTTYTIAEGATPGWQSAGLTCTSGGAPLPDADGTAAGFQLVAGLDQAVSCALTNTAVAASGTVTKTAVGGADTFGFALTPVTAAGTDAGPTVTTSVTTTVDGTQAASALPPILPGQRYRLVEVSQPDWRTTQPLSCTRTVAGAAVVPIVDLTNFLVGVGDVVTCTAVNERLGTVTVVKHAPGVSGATGFGFTADWPGAPPLTLTAGGPSPDDQTASQTFTNVPAGDWTIVEGDGGATVLAEVVCDVDGELVGPFDPTDRTARFTLPAGGDAECVFTNVPPGSVVVTKVTRPAGDTTQPFAFTFDAPLDVLDTQFDLFGAPEAASSRTLTALEAGRYVVTEDATAGWARTALDCEAAGSSTVDGDVATGAATIDLADADAVSCVFVNAQLSSLTVEKTVVGATDDWSFDLLLQEDGADLDTAVVSGTASDATDTADWSDLLDGGTYRLSEEAVDGWTAGAITCTADTGTFVDLDPDPLVVEFVAQGAQSVSCAMTNTRRATLALAKQVLPADADADPALWTLTAAPSDASAPTLTGDGRVDASEVPPGVAYALSEASDYEFADEFPPGPWTCLDASGGTVAVVQTGAGTATLPDGVAPGQVVTCALTNAGEPAVTLGKQARSTSQNPDGTWDVAYDVVVTNERQAIPATYDLDDSLALLGTGITVVQVVVTAPDGSTRTVPGPDADGPIVLARGATLAPGGRDVYGIRLTAAVAPDTWDGDPAALQCAGSDDAPLPGGFRNLAALAVDGEPSTETGSACSAPSRPTVTKEAVSAVAGPDRSWTVTYRVVVANADDAHPSWYDVSDAPQLPAGVDLVTATATNDAGLDTSGWDGATQSVLASGVPIGAGETHTFTVVLDVRAPGVLDADAARCPGAGFRNDAVLATGGTEAPATACLDVTGVDLVVEKTAGPVPGGALDPGSGQPVAYQVTVRNLGPDAATDLTVDDAVPAGLTLDVATIGAPPGWVTSTSTPDRLVATFAGPFPAGAVAVITYTAVVGDPPRPSTDAAYPPVANRACVRAGAPDTDPANDCATTETPVRSVALAPAPRCTDDAAWLDYDVALSDVPLDPVPTVALVWWSAAAFAQRDPTIPASDAGAILADGAARVDTVPLPAGYGDGDHVTGSVLWPGMVLDAAGNARGWPGWQLVAGTWVRSASAPFADLAETAVVEVRVNPSSWATVRYPSAGGIQCGPAAAGGGTGAAGGGVAVTGASSDRTALLALALLLGGVLLLVVRRRRRS